MPESYLLSLEARARANDAERARSNSDLSPLPSEDTEFEPDDDWWYNGMENLFLSRSGEHHYVGSSSSTYLARRLDPTAENMAWDMYPMYNDPSWLRRPADPVLPQLPPYDFAKRLYTSQYIYIGTIFSFLQPRDFEERLNQVYGAPSDFSNREACLAYCQILLIFAYGQMYSVNQWAGTDGPPGFDYFKHALRLLPDIHEEGSILFVEVLSLVGYYMQNLNRRDAAFLYIGLALRMAICLGLHQEVSNSAIDLVEREHRRRVWWSVYSMDRILSVKSGNPITIHDEDIDVMMPSEVAGNECDLTSADVLSHYTQLSQILGRIGQSIYRKKHKSGTSLLSSTQEIMTDLSNWLKHLPGRLQLNLATLDTNLSRESVSVFLHYYQCISMTARPILFYVVQRRIDAVSRGLMNDTWTEGLSGNVISIIDNSITAARNSTIIIHAAAKQNLFATYGFMDGEHIFSAALVLVMVNAAFPDSARDAMAMDTALSVLQSMAQKGNSYIKARHALLVNLQSSIGSTPPPFGSGPASVSLKSQTPAINSGAMLLSPKQAGPQPIPRYDDSLPPNSDLPVFQDMSFNFNVDDDLGFWDEVSGNINFDMDTSWIESTLRSRPASNLRNTT